MPGNSYYCNFVDGMAFDADNYTCIGVNNKTIWYHHCSLWCKLIFVNYSKITGTFSIW
jgi:hypothetical protein